MSTIHLIGDIKLTKIIKAIFILKKVYLISLFDIYPKVIESLILEYTNDIVECTIKKRKKNIDLFSMYRFKIKGFVKNIPLIIEFDLGLFSNIIYLLDFMDIGGYDKIAYNNHHDYGTEYIPDIITMFNEYMKVTYNEEKYINYNNKIINYRCNPNDIKINDYSYIHNTNIIFARETHGNDEDYMCYIKIKNHELFKDVIVIMKCIIDNINKNL